MFALNFTNYIPLIVFMTIVYHGKNLSTSTPTLQVSIFLLLPFFLQMCAFLKMFDQVTNLNSKHNLK